MTERAALELHLARCTLCGACRPGCPTFDATLDEGESGRGRVVLSRSVLDATLAPAPDVIDHLTRCTRCGFCEKACPVGVPVLLGIAHARAAAEVPGWRRRWLFGSIVKSRRRMNAVVGILRFLQRLFGRSRGGRIESLPGIGTSKGLPRLARRSALRRLANRPSTSPGDRPTLQLFVGCRVNYLFPDIAVRAQALLETAGYHVEIPKHQMCSGWVPEGAGALATARELAAHNAAVLPREHRVATLCASCHRGLDTVGEGRRSFPSGIEDAGELIAGSPAFAGRPGTPASAAGSGLGSVLLHVPCSDRHRGSGPEKLMSLFRDRGIAFRLLSGDNCCGGAAPFSVDHPLAARDLGRTLLDRVLLAGEECTLVTSDPGCLLHFRDLAQDRPGLRVLHTIELLDLLLGSVLHPLRH